MMECVAPIFQKNSQVQLSRLVSVRKSKSGCKVGVGEGALSKNISLRLFVLRSWVLRQTIDGPRRYLFSYVFGKDFSKGSRTEIAGSTVGLLCKKSQLEKIGVSC